MVLLRRSGIGQLRTSLYAAPGMSVMRAFIARCRPLKRSLNGEGVRGGRVTFVPDHKLSGLR